MFGFKECSASFHLCSLTDCAMVGFKTISHTDGLPRAVISLFPLPLRVFVVLWSRRGAVCLWQPCRVRSNGSAAACLRMVLLRCAGVPQTLPWKTTFLHPFLHCVHSVVSFAVIQNQKLILLYLSIALIRLMKKHECARGNINCYKPTYLKQ